MVIIGALNTRLLTVKLWAIKPFCRPDKGRTIAFNRPHFLFRSVSPGGSLKHTPFPPSPFFLSFQSASYFCSFTTLTLLFALAPFVSPLPSLVACFFSSPCFSFALPRSVEPSWWSVKCIICDLMTRWVSCLLTRPAHKRD